MSPATALQFPTANAKDWFAPHLDHVFVVDDTLEAPRADDLLPDQQRALLDDLEDLDAWLQSNGVDMVEPLTNEVLAHLWRLREGHPELRRIWTERVEPYIPVGDADVTQLIDLLQQLFPGKVTALGPRAFNPSAARQGRVVVFLDYLLEHTAPEEAQQIALGIADSNASPWERDEGPQSDTAHEHAAPGAEDLALSILTQLMTPSSSVDEGDTNRPYVVLMSSTEWGDPRQRAFRRRANVIRGLFRFIKKSELVHEPHLAVGLSGAVRNLPNAWALQHFAAHVQHACEAAKDQLAARVLDFTVEDYHYCQRLTLSPDGQPLGEYMVWLLNCFHDSAFEEAVDNAGARALLDALTFTDMPAPADGPSSAFVEAYEQAATVRVPDLPPIVTPGHLSAPLSPEAPSSTDVTADVAPPTAPQEVLIALGDIFVPREVGVPERVWMVISPDCDLQWGGRRPFKATRSVTLLAGKVSRVGDVGGVRQTAAYTEFMRIAGIMCRIDWQLKEARTMQYGDVRTFLATHMPPLRRERRLRAPFALEVQQAYGADFTRVGLPVPPALVSDASATLYTRSDAGKPIVVVERMPDVHLARGRGKATLLLGTAFVGALYQYLETIDAHLQARLATLQAKGQFSPIASGETEEKFLRRIRSILEARDAAGKVESARSRITQLCDSFSTALALRGPHPWVEFPKPCSIARKLMTVQWDQAPAGGQPDSEVPLVLVVHSSAHAAAVPGSADAATPPTTGTHCD